MLCDSMNIYVLMLNIGVHVINGGLITMLKGFLDLSGWLSITISFLAKHQGSDSNHRFEDPIILIERQGPLLEEDDFQRPYYFNHHQELLIGIRDLCCYYCFLAISKKGPQLFYSYKVTITK